jgi:hypothetical protein
MPYDEETPSMFRKEARSVIPAAFTGTAFNSVTPKPRYRPRKPWSRTTAAQAPRMEEGRDVRAQLGVALV